MKSVFDPKTLLNLAAWLASGSAAMALEVHQETWTHLPLGGASTVSGKRLDDFGTLSTSFSHTTIYEPPDVQSSSSASTFTSVSPGVLKLATSAFADADPKRTLFGQEPYANADARAQIRYADEFTIGSSDLQAKRGSAQLSLYLPGAVTGGSTWTGPTWGAFFGLTLSFPGGNVTTTDPLTYYAGLGRADVPETIPDDGWIELDFEFTYGVPIKFQLQVDGYSDMQARNGTTGAAAVSFANSLYWAGLADFEVGGESVSLNDITVTSPSGINYLSSFVPDRDVPDGGSALGMLAVAVGAGVAFRRSQRGH